MKIKLNHIRLANDNYHLLDIFTENYYLELGNIDYNNLNRLLNRRIVKVEDIADFNNQNHGVGASVINNEVFRNIIPYIFFDNINRIDESLQLFITYGLVLYTDEDKKQRFAPIVLIPVTIYFEDGACLFQLASNPIANISLIDYLKKKRYSVNDLGHDYNIYSLERYCSSFARFEGIEVRTDNFLTIAKTLQPQTILNHDKFSLKNQFINLLGNKAYVDELRRIYNITPLDNRQRLAIQRASLGNSFGITGFLGTGKTTALINIASDSIARNKKVLYVSNIKETLQRVEKTFSNHYLSGLVMDLTKSSRSMLIGNSLIESSTYDDIDQENLIKGLLENYKIIDDYELNLSKRILNFRFIDVLKEMISVKKPQIDYVIDSLDGIYKHEYLEIITALEVINEKLKKIEVFSECKFNNIPVNHRIKYPNQIMTLLFQLNKSFKDLHNNRETLAIKYHFKDIKNYAMFKNVINNIIGHDCDKIPDSWKIDNLSHFKKALEVYPEIKKLVYSIQEMELYLDWEYENLSSIDINDMVTKIYGPFFTKDDVDRINNILENIIQISAKLHVGKYSSDNYLEQLNRTQNIFDWKFNSDEETEFIIKAIDFLNNNYISNKWFDQSKYKNIRKQINRLKQKLEYYYSLEANLKDLLGDFNEVEQQIAIVERFNITKRFPKKLNGIDLDNLIKDLIEYKELSANIRKVNYDYYTITGRDYSQSDNMILALDAWNEFINGIENKNYVNRFIKFLSHINQEYYQNILTDLNKFLRVYNATNKISNYIRQITGVKNETSNLGKVEEINKFVEYINQLTVIPEIMTTIVKSKKTYYDLDAYLQLQNRINQLEETKKGIIGNNEYKFLYGNLFEDDKTNVNELANYLKHYSNYVECFEDEGGVINSLIPSNYQDIIRIINNSQNVIYEINESFKLYNKIFKDGVGDYYYDDFKDNINYLEQLLNSKEELIAYLEITDNMKVLLKYKLFILNNLITNNKIESVVDLFKYKYFQNIYHIFMVNHNFLDSTKLNNVLEDIINGENDLIKVNIKYLQNLKAAKTVHTKQKQKSYRDFVRRSSKSLFLSTTKVLNYYLDISDFDIIIIDDAQVLHANEYNKAVSGKQIIIAGDNISGTTVFPNLIARMRSSNLVNFNYRYDMSPLSIIDNLPNTLGQFYPEVKLNNGFEISKKNDVTTICELFLHNENYIINYYVNSLSKKRIIIEGVIEYLIDNKVNDNIVYDIIRNRLNILDYNWLYSQESDYNIININDIVDVSNEKLGENNIRNILLAKNKVVFIDEDGLLNNGGIKNSDFLSKIIKEPLYEFIPKVSSILKPLSNDLIAMGINVCGSYGELSMVLEKEGLYYGLMFFSDPEKSHFDILEDYRRYYVNSVNNGLVIINIWILDLVNNYGEVIKRIGEIVKNEFK